MLNIIIKAVFYIITSLFNLVMSPFFSALYALFPSLQEYFGYITNFLVVAVSYVNTCCRLLLIPHELLVLFFDYLLIKYSIYLLNISIKFIIKVYNTFKI